MKKKPLRRRIIRRPIRHDVEFSYKQIGSLAPFLSEQGTILPRLENGLSQQLQKRLSREVKRARFLAMLPFTQMV